MLSPGKLPALNLEKGSSFMHLPCPSLGLGPHFQALANCKPLWPNDLYSCQTICSLHQLQWHMQNLWFHLIIP